ncbi:hypothetical protein Gotri_002571 [Gossypium trilobum]|uniref:Uncharacterized protein n=1 Tax=Gossypium trilobum TaxID=34281 RepID=A0A7J9F909_9ROSI|nr:hypothetical protein [Gossypium trilobum]
MLVAGKEKCLGMMTAAVVVHAFMLVTCLRGQGHVILRTCLGDMGGNLFFYYEILESFMSSCCSAGRLVFHIKHE